MILPSDKGNVSEEDSCDGDFAAVPDEAALPFPRRSRLFRRVLSAQLAFPACSPRQASSVDFETCNFTSGTDGSILTPQHE